ncbi:MULTISPECIES: class I adenylate-forming enzyme family protein [unclassified Bradyrhizobium]|uniref:class I adenylate-forming enzyme family protein n=1 Tax=unclassified Bradyrhizobium TaxID=2631580 RepID=UPI001FF9EA38|nr:MULTISPECIES: class I adenylate-forming enzyme family protein [unclassified Bradyrhizobium]MCK1347282.1 acyl--CoA ligase [Bradyrhizobium sp. CW11]MCK1468302.1 acyl--CoA ligase [Bradyrhizobium sp. CW10]MCK1485502.1 acyl--CoA ligase [Bradyrhizobium sp. 193]MCK1533599.1 acyl--CoA ligase [Bradyrhizobium sp. 176]MCK1555722.1 acyl--CoA ligase [Bradyrhizobium sp. 171]
MRLETILSAQAVRHPDKIALICGDERITYRDLDHRIRGVASALRTQGVGPGDRIVVFLSNGIEIVEVFYAAFSIGAIVVPVTTRLTPHELQHICADCQPAAIVFEGNGSSISEVLQANPDAIWISIGSAVEGAVEYADLRKADPERLPPLSIESDDAIIMYTSGTTGHPKGAIITHSNVVVQHCFINAVEWRISSDDRYLVTTPLAHRTGFARLANSLTLGGTLIVMKKFDPRETVDTIEKEQITVVGMVPTVCRMLLPEIKDDPSRCASLRRIVVTGEAFPVELKRQFLALLPDVRLVSFFAMTEVGGVTSLSHEEQFDHGSSIGRPTPGVEIRIVDDAGIAVKTGEPGELLVRVGQPGQYSVMRGYYNRPDETAITIKDGWIHTGDIAKADDDGYLYIVDRKKDMVLSGGFNIYTKEVEQALLQNPEVADAAVIGVPDAIFGEAVAAFVERSPSASPTPSSVVEHVRNLVAGYKKPKYVIIVDALPRNSLGKVLKRSLRDQAAGFVASVEPRETPPNR